jgi:hypothetical protein
MILSPPAQAFVRRAVEFVCSLLFFGLAWRVWVKAGKIGAYGDTTEVLRILVAPFVDFMALMVLVTGLVHLVKTFLPVDLRRDAPFDPDKGTAT